jgi:cytochrome c oxidase assembly factor CtaG
VALDRPQISGVLTEWTVHPAALAVAIALVAGYVYGLRRLGRPWPRWRIALFAVGIALLVWTTCGFPQVYAHSLYWVWTGQLLVLWLLVPIIVLSGWPIQLAREVAGPGGRLDRLLQSKPVRVLANPLVGPALVPILSGVLFFGPVPTWSIESTVFTWVLHLLLLAVGAAMVLPLVGMDEHASSLAVGLSLAIGSFELVLDALPGIILRLHSGLVTGWFDHRARHSWTPDPLRDQRTAGAILWCLAELIDLPFIAIVFYRWLRADARDAAEIDAVLDAERAARQGLGDAVEPDRDAPWWLTDPAMRDRLR